MKINQYYSILIVNIIHHFRIPNDGRSILMLMMELLNFVFHNNIILIVDQNVVFWGVN